MENEIILWQQAPIAYGHSVLSHNGEIITEENRSYTELLEQVIISDFSSYTLLYKSEMLQLYKDAQRSVFILSNFVETDENDRRIAFVAKIKADSKKEVVQILTKEASLLGKHLSQDEISMITVVLYKKEMLSFVIVFLGLIISLVTIISVFK